MLLNENAFSCHGTYLCCAHVQTVCIADVSALVYELVVEEGAYQSPGGLENA